MHPSAAPFHAEIADGPDGGAAQWITTADGVRIRVGLWPLEGAKGTVLFFPGRTEFIEKYGNAAKYMADRGYASLAVDWRGQGIADRMLPDRTIGHVNRFEDFQKDVAGVLEVAKAANLPEPWHLLGHSMGGAIGLRAVLNGIPVASCAFSGPMWGIEMHQATRVFANFLGTFMPILGMAGVRPPGSKPEHLVTTGPFEDNVLTTDRAMFEAMGRQLELHPELTLGGPSIGWIKESLDECDALHALPSPDLPCVTFLGSNERIVDCARIHDRMGRWPGGRLEVLQDGEHEVLLETPQMRTAIFDQLAAHCDAAS